MNPNMLAVAAALWSSAATASVAAAPAPADRYASRVRGKRAAPAAAVARRLDAAEVARLPGTQGDALKALQSLPGVARAPYGIGMLSVWGSAPRDTRVYLDGVPIPMLYHFGGLRSAVSAEGVRGLSFVPGGYGAERGLGLGGVVDLESRRPRGDGLHGAAQLDLLDGALSLEGPLGPRWSFAVAARRSWVDAALPLFTTSTFQVSPSYGDYQARLAWRPGERDEVDLALVGAGDQLTLERRIGGVRAQAARSRLSFHRLIAGWTRRFEGGASLALVSWAGLDVPLALDVTNGAVPTSIHERALAYGARATLRLPVASWLSLDGGLDFEGTRYAETRAGVARPPIGGATGASAFGFGEEAGDFGGAASGYAAGAFTAFANHGAPFVAARVSLFGERLTVTPQLRLQVLSLAVEPGGGGARVHVAVEPRLTVRWRVTDRVALTAAGGAYTQPPPFELLSPAFGNPALGPERALHLVAGAEVELTPALRLGADVFGKRLRDLASASPPVANDGEGRAYGIEVLLRRQLADGWFGWAAYTLSRSERRVHPGDPWSRYLYDQTHVLTLVASRALPRGFQVGARFRHATGNPYTPVVGAYFESNLDRFRPLLGPPASARLPSFDQLDLRVDKLWTFARWRLGAYLDVQNVLRASNPEAVQYSYDFTVKYPVSGLPLLPVAGVRGEF